MSVDPRFVRVCAGVIGFLFVAALFWNVAGVGAQDEALDPAAWGEDHVSKQLPMYVTGGECLFCHRNDIGVNWQTNRHNEAMKYIEAASDPALDPLRDEETLKPLLDEILYVVGDTRMKRFLKPNGKYGQVSMLNTKFLPAHGDVAARLEHAGDPAWDENAFAESCAGCHATAVETEYKAFSTFAIDCYQCHGDVPAAHNSEPALALLAKTSTAGPQAELSICAQCHLRGGKSKTSEQPYPNQFVPGDNLFRDFEVDFSEEYIAALNPADRHVYENVRDVVVRGNTEMTCMTCHDVHGMSSRKHKVLERLNRHEYCASCHDDADDYASIVEYEVHSGTCEY